MRPVGAPSRNRLVHAVTSCPSPTGDDAVTATKRLPRGSVAVAERYPV